MLRASLGTCLIAAALLAATAAGAGDRSITNAVAGPAREIDGCVRPVAWQPGGGRCALVEPAAGQVLSDHGMMAGEAYDAQGNPVDRHGDVIAVPAGRASQAREVFARDQGAFR
jgi:hypothetical protein